MESGIRLGRRVLRKDRTDDAERVEGAPRGDPQIAQRRSSRATRRSRALRTPYDTVVKRARELRDLRISTPLSGAAFSNALNVLPEWRSIAANSAFTRMLSLRTFSDAAAIRSARARVSTSRFMRSMARRIYSARGIPRT